MWLPQYLPQFDMGYDVNTKFSGYSVNPSLELKPSEYVLRQCRFSAFPMEDPITAAGALGDVFCFGSDWPHPEGVSDPLRDYQAIAGLPTEDDPASTSLYRDNAAWLLQAT